MSPWIAVDWGTTALRAWRMSGAVAQECRSSAEGMGKLAPGAFEAALLRLIGDWLGRERTEVVACGMVGARQGWREAAYRAVPARPLDAPFLTVAPEDPRFRLHIVPGLSQADPADVMRGEETQIAGFLASVPDYDGVIGLPGTHMKWARIAAGEVRSFQTCLTGELFALLAQHSVLRHGLGAGWEDAAFVAAVAEMQAAPDSLMAALFSLRAGGLLGQLSPDAARARLSGLLIGAELAATRALWQDQPVTLIGAGTLTGRYRQALQLFGQASSLTDAEAVTLAGLCAAYRKLQESPR
ncbi:MAG: 2-dehydro-3-deoxygalactonokinase [Gemmobacter sp.]|uniref:2-dehydro-3-deoxygalactonokinase n=1 Tax=Gemmobacter sp. TaxID=1898957 RepID=UPI001A58AF3D|nr:2-dehydro-3-deoxygalactonokinase [Gemmobacter sp.]MBL8563766.1 2-dehydro-3-deoxygalactonokinase [Gemmobacter sp.]